MTRNDSFGAGPDHVRTRIRKTVVHWWALHWLKP